MNKICKNCEYADWAYAYVRECCKDCSAGSNHTPRTTYTPPQPITEAQWEVTHE